MTLDGSVRIAAGVVIIISLILFYTVSPYWLFLTLFVALNLIQSSFTGFCPAEIMLKKLFFSKQPK